MVSTHEINISSLKRENEYIFSNQFEYLIYSYIIQNKLFYRIYTKLLVMWKVIIKVIIQI